MRKLVKICVCCFFAFAANVITLSGQDTIVSEPSQLFIRNANNYIAELLKDSEKQYLKGNVQLVHDSVFMYCDSAIVIKNQMIAIGDVVIIKPDSINVFSDSLYYDGDQKIAELFYGVVLENFDKQLFTERLHYDMNEEVATFSDTAVLRKATMHLSSIEGRYDMRKKMAIFKKEVTIIDDEFKLASDSLRYDIDIDRAYFICPTYITQGERQIYCESGYYDVDIGRAHFSKEAIIRKKDQKATAESILYSKTDSTVIFTGNAVIIDSSSITKGDKITIDDRTGEIEIIGKAYYETEEQVISGPHIQYNKNTEDIRLPGRSSIFQKNSKLSGDTILYVKATDFGNAKGNVIWQDTIEGRMILADQIYYRDSTSYYKAVPDKLRPLFIQEVDGDSLFLSADTLIRSNATDSTGYMVAIGGVMIYKSDMQAICDSLYYSDIDSSFTLFRDPVCWSDTTQFVGDTIKLILQGGKVREITAFSDAFIISEDPNGYYDQIKGRIIRSLLDSNQLKSMHVKGNAESIYIVKDDENAYVGANKTLCSELKFFFVNKELNDIRYYGEPASELVPFEQAGETDLKLSGFKWRQDERPESVGALRILRLSSRRRFNDRDEPVDAFERDVMKVLEGEAKAKKEENIDKKSKSAGKQGIKKK